MNSRTSSVALALLVSTSAAAAETAPALGPAESAAVEALRGNVQRARAIIGSIKGAKSEPAALVVLACLALEEGFTGDAAQIAGRLRTRSPKATEGLVLEALARERAARPRGDWLSAGLTALTKIRPLPVSTPLLDPDERIPLGIYDGATSFPEEKASKLGAADAFVARWAWPRGPQGKPDAALVEAAIRFANADERPLVHLAALDVLESAEATDHTARLEALAAARRAIEGKLRDTPAGRRRLIGMTRRERTDPIEESEVVAFEAAVADALPTSYALDFAELYRILAQLDRCYAPNLAFSGAVDLTVAPPFVIGLGDRLKKSRLSPSMRERLAAALVRWVDQQQREGVILGDMLAALALVRASDLRSDAALKERANAIRAESDKLRDALRCLHPLMRLPIPSLQRAWALQAPNERALAQQMVRMGLGCPEPKASAPPLPEAQEPTQPCPNPSPATPETR